MADALTSVPAMTAERRASSSVASYTSSALGTPCSVLVTRSALLAAAQRILTTELAAIDLACSRFRPDSELSALNRSAGQWVAVSPLFARALAVALQAAEATDGDVDPTCGRSLVNLGYDRDYGELADFTGAKCAWTESASAERAHGEPAEPAAGWHCIEFDEDQQTVLVPAGVMLDLGATAKALAADLAASKISALLDCGVLVNLGGDIAVAGEPPDGGWRVAVDDGVTMPGPVVVITDGGLATSSPSVRTWRRGDQLMHHIIAPDTGLPAETYWAAVTVAAASCVDANTASTASIIRGPAATAWLEGLGVAARLARPDATVLTTGAWPS